MAKMMLVNPARRAKRRNPIGMKRRRVSVKRRRNPVDTLSGLARRRRIRRNPIAAVSRVKRRRRNPIANLGRRMRRRRRNPIGSLNMRSMVAMFTDAALGGAGAVGMDLLMGQLNTYIPITFQTIPGMPGLGNVVKAGITAILGQGLDKYTKGYSSKMAAGALTVQTYDILRVMLPASMSVGYYTPAQLVQGSARVGPRPGMAGMRRYMPSGSTPLLSAYMPAGQSPLLSRGASTAEQEGFRYR